MTRRNVLVLSVAQALGGASGPIIISLGGIVGQMLSPAGALVTLPVTCYHMGLALGALPASFIMRHLGRRSGYLLGATLGMLSGLIATFGIISSAFLIFCLGTLIAGFYGSYVQSYRFAAADEAAGPLKARAISSVMVGGLVAAVIGPQLVIWMRDAIPGVPFAGSFISQTALAVLALPVLAFFRATRPTPGVKLESAGRPLRQIMLKPRFILAVATGIVSYGLMSFMMTAAPIAMVGCGFTVGEAALGIQWHVLGMFMPSFFTGRLITRFGKEKVMAFGLLLIAASAAVALSGIALTHFWLSLVLLGLGWNFGFIGATAMVTDCHTHEERGKVQGMNDFLIFGSVAVASFSSGTLLSTVGWEILNWAIFPIVAAVLVPLLWQARAGARPAGIA
ncbi:MFS transporter [Agaricicola taiwanensis]|uniref:MFS transporter n=1 Tax=Agaricicola taiwanensis TaxID=591372 RepID=UPI00280A9743|nr:MFS transporter [Agaricicola taiwanensis]